MPRVKRANRRLATAAQRRNSGYDGDDDNGSARFTDAWPSLLAAVVIYPLLALTIVHSVSHESLYPYFSLLARAFLHGHLDVIPAPQSDLNDLSFFQGVLDKRLRPGL